MARRTAAARVAPTTVRVAAVQAAPVFLDLDASVERALELVEEAAVAGAELVVFPEAFLPGPPVWIDQVLPREDAAWYERLLAQSVVVPGPVTRRLGDAARRTGTVLVIGVNERDPHGGTVYNTVLYFDADGTLLGKHRKLVPTHSERLVWGMGDGSDLVVHDTAVGRVGGLICWENFMPLARFALYQQGVDIWVAPTLATHEAWVASMRHVAREGVCHVVGVGPAIRYADVPETVPDRERLWHRPDGAQASDEDWILHGYSVVVAPDTTVLAGPVAQEQTILTADLDLVAGRARRRLFDPVGHYNRPDVFRLVVDDRPKPALVRYEDAVLVEERDAVPVLVEER